MQLITKIKQCRICNSSNLVTIVSLGPQYLTGIFPKDKNTELSKWDLDLVRCSNCELVQMKYSYDLNVMYGDNYGYKSSLNASMVYHLQQKVLMLEKFIRPDENDIVIDIGSNDATLLKSYKDNQLKIGIDPTGVKFKEHYTDNIKLIPEFFTAETFNKSFPNKKAKIITSIAMFYDLESPTKFVQDIEKILSNDGVWHFEQSYMPSMIRENAYDTICHEHIEFYSLKVVKNLLENNGLKIIDVSLNTANGGSFAVTACKYDAFYSKNTTVINWLINMENEMGFSTPKPFREFEDRIFNHKKNLMYLIENLVADGKKIIGYGASTKGNVLLQFCGLNTSHIPYMAEVNSDKFGCYTPGTNIPIISEKEAKLMKPDYYLVLPWHFKHSILQREQEYLSNGGKFIFPLPNIEIV